MPKNKLVSFLRTILINMRPVRLNCQRPQIPELDATKAHQKTFQNTVLRDAKADEQSRIVLREWRIHRLKNDRL